MKESTTYTYKGRENLVIENGILIGAKAPYITKHNSYGEFILDRMRASPEFIGQVDGLTGKQESFAEMTEKSVKCAIWLREQNIKPGDIIAISTHNQMDMYVPCLASLYIGAISNPWWRIGDKNEMVRYFLDMTCPNVLFADEATAKLALEVAKEIDIPLKIVVFGTVPGFLSLNCIIASKDTKIVSSFQCTQLSSLDSPAVIIHTSGTVGLPKGALYSHKTLFGSVANFTALGRVEGTTTTMVFSTLGWITGVLSMLRGFVVPDTRIIPPEFTEEVCLQLIEKFKVSLTVMGVNPLVRIQKSPVLSNYDLSSLKYIYVGGSVMKEETHRAITMSFPQTKVLQIYGSTEMGGMVLQENCEQTKSGSCGSVVKNITMKVIDPDSGQVLGPNKPGEACFKFPFMMIGYYNDAEATNEVIDAEGWMHTGDLVYYNEVGDVFIIDRMTEIIKYKDQQVAPAMIEQVLQEHPDVIEAAVIGLPHDDDGKHPIAFVAKKPDAQVTKEELQKRVMDKLPDYMKLRGGVKFLNELPHTASGKIDRGQLKKIVQSIKAH